MCARVVVRASNLKISRRCLPDMLDWVLHLQHNRFTLSTNRVIDSLHVQNIPFKVRAITCKNYLLKIYPQHGNFLNAI